MKYFLLTAVLAMSAAAAGLEGVKSVYLLPMSRGLDQYLAERLTSQGVFKVVTDPKMADAIFTDRIGANFEQSVAELYKAPESTKAKKDDKDTEEELYSRPASQPLSRGKGNIFLVDRGNHSVLWSTFLSTTTSDAKELSRAASEIASRLAKTRKAK